MNGLKDKIALVTGAASGIGEAVARRLAAEGAKVFIADLPGGAGLEVAASVGGRFVPLDVTDEAAWAQAIAGVVDDKGRLDILVNSAGIVGDVLNGAFDRMTLVDWRRVMTVNLDGTFLGCQAAMSVMKPRGQGAIVNLASVASYYPTSQNAAYGASKAAVMQLTKTVALFGSGDGARVRCNSVHPGQIATPMLARIKQERSARAATGPQPSSDRLPLGIGEAGDVSALVAFLASDDAKYITGGEFTVDGGWRLLR